MKVFELLEGGVKRYTDPRLSGDDTSSRSSAGPWKYPEAPRSKARPHEAQIRSLADKAKVSFTKAAIAWDEAASQVDDKLPGKWAIVMNKTKRALGID